MDSLITIDVAHPPLSQALVEDELDRLLQQALRGSTVRALKIIHGYGRSGKGGSTKQVILNWAYRNRQRIREVIQGEEYSRFDLRVQDLWAPEGYPDDPDLDGTNRGITIVRIR